MLHNVIWYVCCMYLSSIPGGKSPGGGMPGIPGWKPLPLPRPIARPGNPTQWHQLLIINEVRIGQNEWATGWNGKAQWHSPLMIKSIDESEETKKCMLK